MPHDYCVTSLTSLPANASRTLYSKGCIICGCTDSKIRIFDSETNSLQRTLEKHTKGVISLSWVTTSIGDLYLLSGSLDGTANVWDLSSNSCIQELAHLSHDHGVHVLGLSDGNIATVFTDDSVNGGPANYILRIWNLTGDQICRPFDDHKEPIRAIQLVWGASFATVANDEIIVRDPSGKSIVIMRRPLQEDGTPSSFLNCCALDVSTGMDTVSCGEDGSVMIWSETELLQSIPHSACVWCVLSVPNSGGDFITGGNDGVLRVFSRNPDTIARNEGRCTQLMLELESAVVEAAAALNRAKNTGPSQEEIAKAPMWDDRGSRPGRAEGDVCVYNKNGTLIAAQWMSGAWVFVGEVTGKGGDGGQINGEHYDHILPVEIDTPQGSTTMQLGHNNGENPFVAAQRFIDQNQLQQSYLAQVADWITARSGQQATPTLGMDGAGSGSGGVSGSGSGYAAPMPPAAPVELNFAFKLILFVCFDDVPSNKDKLFAKIAEFNDAASASGTSITDADMAQVASCLSTVCATSHYHASSIPEGQVKALMKMKEWGTEKLFPFFDLMRLISVHPQGIGEYREV